MFTKQQYIKALIGLYLINGSFFIVTLVTPLLILIMVPTFLLKLIYLVGLYIAYSSILLAVGVSWVEKGMKRRTYIIDQYHQNRIDEKPTAMIAHG